MAILRTDVPYFAELFAIPGFLCDPVLTFGVQDTFGFRPTQLESWSGSSFGRKLKKSGLGLIERMQALAGHRHPDLTIPEQFKEKDLTGILAKYGCRDITTLDFFDERADLKWDMNKPIPAEFINRFNTIVDIGCLEHVFDTRQCLQNLFSMLRVQGHILLHTPCKGWLGHGLHTFSPECIMGSLEVNGFEVLRVKYAGTSGVPLNRPEDGDNVIMWIVAKKLREVDPFEIVQQGCWSLQYGTESATQQSQ